MIKKMLLYSMFIIVLLTSFSVSALSIHNRTCIYLNTGNVCFDGSNGTNIMTGSYLNWSDILNPQSGGGSGDLTDVLAGLGINVTNSAGPSPIVSINKSYLDLTYAPFGSSGSAVNYSIFLDAQFNLTNKIGLQNSTLLSCSNITGAVSDLCTITPASGGSGMTSFNISNRTSTFAILNNSVFNITSGTNILVSLVGGEFTITNTLVDTNDSARVNSLNSSLLTQTARIDSLNTTKLNITDGRYNETVTSISFIGNILNLARNGYSTLTASIPSNSILLSFFNITGTFNNAQVGLASINNESLNTTNTGIAGQVLSLGANSQFTWITPSGGSGNGNVSSLGTIGYIPIFYNNTQINNSVIYQQNLNQVNITANLTIGTGTDVFTVNSNGTNALVQIIGELNLTSVTSGQSLCRKTDGNIGECTSAVGIGGACTCS